MKNPAVWTNDCQSKQDFDGEAVSISTRYWPGYLTVFDTAHPEKGLHKVSDGGPSATASLILRSADEQQFVLTEKDFAGSTEAEVKREVEAWVQSQFDRMAAALRKEFGA